MRKYEETLWQYDVAFQKSFVLFSSFFSKNGDTQKLKEQKFIKTIRTQKFMCLFAYESSKYFRFSFIFTLIYGFGFGKERKNRFFFYMFSINVTPLSTNSCATWSEERQKKLLKRISGPLIKNIFRSVNVNAMEENWTFSGDYNILCW